MITPMSKVVDLYEAEFSAEPPYSIDSPTDFVDSISPTDKETVSSDNDIFAALSREKNQHYSYWSPPLNPETQASNEAIFSVVSIPADQDNSYWTPSFNWEDDTGIETSLIDYFRSIAPVCLSKLSHDKNTYYWLNKIVGYSLLTDYPKVQRNHDKVTLYEAALDYFAILSDHLNPLSFMSSDEYEDVFGGRVVDYFKDKERITCIVSKDQVQILSYINGVISDRLFKRTDKTKLIIIEYVEELLE